MIFTDNCKTEKKYRALRDIETSDGTIKKDEFIPNPDIFERIKTLVNIGWVECVEVVTNESQNIQGEIQKEEVKIEEEKKVIQEKAKEVKEEIKEKVEDIKEDIKEKSIKKR